MNSNPRVTYLSSSVKILDDIRLKIKSIYSVIPVEDHKVHLHRGDEAICLDTNEISSRILLCLDGQTSVKQLFDRFGDQISRKEILGFLLALRRENLIFDSSNEVEDQTFECHPQLASRVLDELRIFGKWRKYRSRKERNLDDRICIIGDGNDAHKLGEILEAAGIESIDRLDPENLASNEDHLSSCGAAAIIFDSFKPTLLKRLNRFLSEKRIPFTHGTIEGGTASLGPTVSGNMSPCLDCYVSRLEEHNPYLYVYERFEKPRNTDETARRFLAVKLAQEIMKLVEGGKSLVYGGRVCLFDLSENTVSFEHIIERYDCPACGEKSAERRDGPVRLSSRSKVRYFDNGHRTVRPEESLSKTQHLIGRLGIVASIERIDDESEVRLPIFASYTTATSGAGDGAPELRLHCGKGVSTEQARASAVFESIERYCARPSSREAVVVGTWSSLQNKTYPLESFSPPARWNCPKCRNKCGPLDMEIPIEWVWGYSLAKSEPVLLPANQVFLPYRVQQGSECRSYVMSDSNGLAAGNSIEEAVLHAALEVIEREAVTIFHRTGRQACSINMDTVKNPLLEYAIDELEKSRLELLVVYIPYGIIHTACALLIDRTTDRSFYATGSGSHTDPEIAVVRSITEANHVRIGIRHALKSQTYDVDERQFDLDSVCTFFRTEKKIDLSEISNLSSSDILGDIKLILNRLEKINSDILIYDLTRRAINIPVVRVILPWIQPADTFPCYRPTERLKQHTKNQDIKCLYMNDWLW